MAEHKSILWYCAAAAVVGAATYAATRNSPTTFGQEYGCLINNIKSGNTANVGYASVIAGRASLCP